MTGIEPIRRGLERAWDSVQEGWRHLREHASGAITHFFPPKTAGEAETPDEQVALASPRWGVMAANVRETGKEVIVELEAPGMEPEDFELQVYSGYLVVSGEKRFQRTDDDGRFHVLETAYGRFDRAVPLPAEVDEAGAKARYRKGVLQVTLPKPERARSRRIEVESG